MPLDVCQVNLGRRLAILTNGELIAIERLLDHDGDDTDDPAQARAFVAGPDSAGKWWEDTLESYSASGPAATRH